MTKEPAAVAETPFYANIIARHINERCGFLNTTQVEQILDTCELELVSGQVTN